MAWCPKCKNEYREGITVCADCGIPLVEELVDDSKVPLMYGQGDQLNALKGFMEYSGLRGVELRFNEKESYYELFVRKEDQKTAIGMASVFVRQLEQRKSEEVQTEDTLSGKEEPQEEAPRQEQVIAPAVKYQSSAEKAKDNKSSGWMLIIVGLLGLSAMALCMFGVIPFRMGGATYMFYGVMSTIFILFAVMGAVSLKNAKLFAQNAQSEDTLHQSLVEWCKENLKAEEIDRVVGAAGTAEEEVYFKRYAYIKARLNQQFLNLDQAFLDQFIDNEVYDMIYEEK